MGQRGFAGLSALAVQSAERCLASGDIDDAWEWLGSVADTDRPARLVAACHDVSSRVAADSGRWAEAAEHAVLAARSGPHAWRQTRVALLRSRRSYLADTAWATIGATVQPAQRLPANWLVPEVTEVAACGAYFSRGTESGAPWSRYLRMGKSVSFDDAEREAAHELAGAFFARYVAERTHLMRVAEAVVPVPANPERYALRMSSVPDRLAESVESALALPKFLNALAWASGQTHVEMKKLDRGSRRDAASRAFIAGPQADRLTGRVVLLVDDVTTSGSTLRACAAALLTAGAAAVVACCLAHTEG